MDKLIEVCIETPDGTADCRIEMVGEGGQQYEATILYPNSVDGFLRSEVYCHMMQLNGSSYQFMDGEELHPKVKKLEEKISAAITQPV